MSANSDIPVFCPPPSHPSLGPLMGVPMSHVKFTKWFNPLLLKLPCHMSPVKCPKCPMTISRIIQCRVTYFLCPCRGMSILRNGCVAVSNQSIKGHRSGPPQASLTRFLTLPRAYKHQYSPLWAVYICVGAGGRSVTCYPCTPTPQPAFSP